jgi:DNA polymerase III gamma/tau subunit
VPAFRLPNIPTSEIAKHLEAVVKEEGVKAEPDWFTWSPGSATVR